MKEKREKTVGSISLDLAKKAPDSRDPIELEREAHKDYEQNVLAKLEEGKRLYDNDFYIVVLTKKERLMSNVLRHYYLHRISCPTPDYDQTVYRYSKKDNDLVFLWTLPSKDTCQLFLANRHIIDPLEWELLKFILQFEDGSLMRTAKKLNGESVESELLLA